MAQNLEGVKLIVCIRQLRGKYWGRWGPAPKSWYRPTRLQPLADGQTRVEPYRFVTDSVGNTI